MGIPNIEQGISKAEVKELDFLEFPLGNAVVGGENAIQRHLGYVSG